MLAEVLEYLRPTRGGYFIDGTLGGGGYTSALSKEIGKSGKILAIDLDKDAVENARAKNIKNLVIANDNFRNLSEIIKNEFEEDISFDGIVFDLGLSSYQLKDRARGFSFREVDQPLDMAFSQDEKYQTRDIVNKGSEEYLTKIILEYGEERYAKSIARRIVKARLEKKIEKVGDLLDIIMRSFPRKDLNKKIHPATKTFQALRIATNKELESLEEVLPQAIKNLKKGGRLAVISFHSLEDRIVKQYFKKESIDCHCPPKFPICSCGHKKSIKIITKKALMATDEEILKNPRSRSAKMRVVEKV